MNRLALENFSLMIGERVLIKPFSHHFSANTVVALVGDNGSGKTTLLKTLAGLSPFCPQTILLDHVDLCTMNCRTRAQQISMLFQHSPAHPYCTAQSRIAHGLIPSYGFQHFLDENMNYLLEEVAAQLNITHLLPRRLAEMSGGEQRLVNIAKCLISPHAKVLLLDEPSVFLDFTQQENLITNLLRHKSHDRLVIFSSHDASFISRVADYMLMIRNGEMHQLTSLNALR